MIHGDMQKKAREAFMSHITAKAPTGAMELYQLVLDNKDRMIAHQTTRTTPKSVAAIQDDLKSIERDLAVLQADLLISRLGL